MLLRITERCHGMCTHCMVNATPEGKHMDMETFVKSLIFIKRYDPALLIISGGEPTEHPNICEIVTIAKTIVPNVELVSNGHFLFNEELTEKILSLGIKIQITYDERYYKIPIPKDKLNHPLIFFVSHIHQIYPQGRAVTNDIKQYNAIAPKCFNLRSLCINNGDSLKDAIKYMEHHSKFCTPSINIDGSISLGESNECYRIGNVSMDDKELLNNLLSMKCNRCGLESKLSVMCKKAIGIQ